MTVLVAILTTLAAGMPVTLAIDRRANGTGLAGLSFLYGTALVYFSELALSLAGVRWSLLTVNAAILSGSAACLVLARRHPAAGAVRDPVRFHFIDLATVFTVGCYSLYATLAPVWGWDFWAIWGLKARVFLGTGSIDWIFLTSRWNAFVHPDYPLLLPLNYVYAGLTAGGWSDRWLGVESVAFAVALLLIIRQHAAAETSPAAAATITFTAACFACNAFIGLAEGPLIAFGTAAVLFARRAFHGDSPDAMRHAALLAGCAGLCKNEGLALLVAIAIALAAFRRTLLGRLWPAAAVLAPWLILKALFALGSDFAEGSVPARVLERLTHPIALISALARELPDERMWLLMVSAFAVIAPRFLKRERFILTVVAVQVVFYVGAYLATPHELVWHVATSWPRLTQQIAPMFLYAVLVMLARTALPGDDHAHAQARPDL